MNDHYLLAVCLKLIEEKVQWGESKHWLNSDFQNLSDGIYEVTHIRISVPTLQRLFGKKKTYKGIYNPQLVTKNALSIFAGYKDWGEFKTVYSESVKGPDEPIGQVSVTKVSSYPTLETSTAPASSSTPHEPFFPDRPETKTAPAGRQDTSPFPFTAQISPVLTGVLAVSGIILLSWLFLSFYQSHSLGTIKPPHYDFYFKGKYLKGKVPVSAIFQYDISRIESDSVFLYVEEFNTKQLLPKHKHIITLWYQFPGLYHVHLLVNNQKIASEIVHVTDEDWLTYLRDDAGKLFARSLVKSDSAGIKYISPATAKTLLKASPYWVKQVLTRDFGVNGDHFAFEVKAKNNFRSGPVQCNDIVVGLTGEKEKVHLHFLKPGCTVWAKVEVGEQRFLGQDNDLSALGVDFSDWKTIRIEIRNKRLYVSIDQKPIYSVSYRQPIGDIKALYLETRESGAFDDIKLYNAHNKLVFEDRFD